MVVRHGSPQRAGMTGLSGGVDCIRIPLNQAGALRLATIFIPTPGGAGMRPNSSARRWALRITNCASRKSGRWCIRKILAHGVCLKRRASKRCDTLRKESAFCFAGHGVLRQTYDRVDKHLRAPIRQWFAWVVRLGNVVGFYERVGDAPFAPSWGEIDCYPIRNNADRAVANHFPSSPNPL